MDLCKKNAIIDLITESVNYWKFQLALWSVLCDSAEREAFTYSLSHTLLKETSARGCDIIALGTVPKWVPGR